MAEHKIIDSPECKEYVEKLDKKLVDRITRIMQQPDEGEQGGGYIQQNQSRSFN